MNRSITQKILLVILLVTVMDGGTLAASGTSTTSLGIIQKSGPLINGMASTMVGHWQLTHGSNCPYHRNLSRRNVQSSGGISN
jgi:hypothetical protein